MISGFRLSPILERYPVRKRASPVKKAMQNWLQQNGILSLYDNTLGNQGNTLGRKSRLKRERRELKALGLPEQSSNNLVSISENHASVFRFFQKEWQADALVSGKFGLLPLNCGHTNT